MAEGQDPGQTSAKFSDTPTLTELSNALGSVVNWHLLGVKLGLEDHELSAIEQNYRGDRCKSEMLIRWLRSAKLPPTWKAVVDALQQMGEQAISSKIRAEYCGSSTESADTADTATPPATTLQSLSAIAVAQRNIRMIEGKFSTLVTKSCRRLQSKKIKIKVKDVQMFLVTMYSSRNSRDGSDTVTTVVESAKSLDTIFLALSKHRLWDYLNYYLLQSIIEEFASDDDELNDMMKQYQQDLTGHILTLRIQNYLEATKHSLAKSHSETPTDEQIDKLFSKLTAKCEINVTNHTVSYVTDLWRSLANQLALPRPAMILHDIAEGCIGITWLIPANLVKHVTQMARETTNMFAEENVLRVTLEEQCIYPMETKPPPLETETAALKRKSQGNTSPSWTLHEERSVDISGRRSLDLPTYLQHIQYMHDERENPEDISEYELTLRGCIVMCTNYSFLWQYLEPSRLLSILVEKLLMTETARKEAESYGQKFAQNSVIIQQLFASDCPPLKLCDTLDVTGQEHIARKLLQDYKHPSSQSVPLPSADTAVHSTLSETSKLFQQLQQMVMDLLDQFPNALAKLKQVLASLVLPLGEGKVVPLVDPLAYENAQTVRELFRLMAPYWNPLSTDLLGILLEASGCNQAASKVAEFVEARASKGHLVLCIRQLPTLASGENDLDVADLETVHNAPLSELQSLHPAVFARLPEHKVTSTRTTVRISVEVNKPLVCIADYEQIATAVSGLFELPKAALVYAGCSKAPLVLCWLAFHDLAAYSKSTSTTLSGRRLLVENKVTRIAVGDELYKFSTIKELELDEACYYGVVGQVHHLLTAGVNVNLPTFNGWTALKQASAKGHHKVVELLLGGGANPDIQDQEGYLPLHDASARGYDEIVEMLLQAGATVDLQTKDGASPLYSASQEGHDRIVEMLLQAGATVDLQMKSGDTPLTIASYEGHSSVVRVLLQGGANINTTTQSGMTALHCAVNQEHEDIVDLLLEANADPDVPVKDSQETALMAAAEKGNVEIVRKLIHHGASRNLTNKDGYTALRTASFNGHHKVVELLLGAGANPDIQDKDGGTPLYVSSQEGHDGTVEMLLQAGATVNLQLKDGGTPLYAASQEGHDEIVEMLLQAGATVDLQLKSGDTPLIIASDSGHSSVVRVLLQGGANINTTTEWGGTALHCAVNKEHEDIVELMLEANADPDVPLKDSQQTALMAAAEKGNVEIVRKLIHHGASRNLTNKDGNTAYDLASFEGHNHVCQELLTKQSS